MRRFTQFTVALLTVFTASAVFACSGTSMLQNAETVRSSDNDRYQQAKYVVDNFVNVDENGMPRWSDPNSIDAAIGTILNKADTADAFDPTNAPGGHIGTDSAITDFLARLDGRHDTQMTGAAGPLQNGYEWSVDANGNPKSTIKAHAILHGNEFHYGMDIFNLDPVDTTADVAAPEETTASSTPTTSTRTRTPSTTEETTETATAEPSVGTVTNGGVVMTEEELTGAIEPTRSEEPALAESTSSEPTPVSTSTKETEESSPIRTIEPSPSIIKPVPIEELVPPVESWSDHAG
jgi:hypothetical protein